MMNLGNFKLLKEDNDSFHLEHPNGRKLILNKEKLSPESHDMIRGLKVEKFVTGGTAGSVSDSSSDNSSQSQPSQQPVNIHIYNGGAPQPDPQTQPQPQPSASQQLSDIEGQLNQGLQSPAPINPNPELVSNPTPPPVTSSTPAPSSSPTPSALPSPNADSDWKGSYGVVQPLQAPEQAPPEAAQRIVNQASAPVTPQSSALDKQLSDLNDQYNASIKQQVKSDQDFANLLQSKKTDPNRYLSNLGTGNKVLAGLSLFLGGIGSGLTHQPNAALGVINKAIDDDIDAQKNDQSNVMNLWKMHHDALGNQIGATLQTKNNMLEMAKAKVDELMGSLPGAAAQQRAQELKSQLSAQQAQNNASIAQTKVKQSILNGNNTTDGQSAVSNQDPATFVPYLVPEAQQKGVFDEIKNAQNVTANGPKILDAFDQAAKEQRVLAGGNPKNLIPGVNSQGVGSLHQLLLPNFKSIDGTVRQAAMDETFKNLTPQAFDNDARIEQKRQALQDWLRSEAAAPTAKGYGIDLSKFRSTSESPTVNFTPQQQQNLQIYMKNNPGVSQQAAVSKLKQNGYL